VTHKFINGSHLTQITLVKDNAKH